MNLPAITRILTVRGHTFIPRLTTESTVVDLGANDGGFATEMVRRFGCRVVAVEPSPQMYARIPDEPQISRRNCAVAARAGTAAFHVAQDPLASSLCTIPSNQVQQTILVDVLTLEDLLAESSVSSIDLLKVDIEGAERDLLATVSDDILLATTQASVEFHDFCGLVTPDEIRTIARRMRGLGFYEIQFPPGHANTLYINLQRWRHPARERWFVKYVSRNLQRLRRSLL